MAPTAIYDIPLTTTGYPEHDSILPLSPSYYGPLKADPAVFPDGLKTSGQHCPIASLIRPYEDYPKKIEGPTVWGKADFQEHPDKWQRTFTADEVEEIGQAADDFIASGVPLTGISKALFPLPKLDAALTDIREEILNGKGFILFKGLPVTEWGLHKSAAAYMGLGTYFGYFTTQNGRGHVLGHVKDLGAAASKPGDTAPVRIYRTNQRQYFHTDGADLVGLLCIARALEGGESDIASTHAVWNYLQANHPAAAKLLSSPVWYIDRKGEQSEGEAPYYRTSPFLLENDPDGKPRVYARFDPKNADSLGRFWEGANPELPRLSDEQIHAMKCLEEAANASSLHMILQPGDIQLLANTHVLHARTAYKDYPAGEVDENGRERSRRHLMRLWLATPETEGGWKLAQPDSKRKKRGGIQVNDNAPTCPLDAE